MTGFEIAGVVLGVLPVLVEAVQAYQKLWSQIDTIRNFSTESGRIMMKFHTQRQLFLNECRLLLRYVVRDDQQREEMLEDTSHRNWNVEDEKLDKPLSHWQKENLSLCESIIEESRAVLEEIGKELEKFNVFRREKLEGESLKAAIVRLRKSISFSFDKSKYEKSIKSLRDHNQSLTQLRLHLVEFGKIFYPPACLIGTCQPRKTLPSHITAIRQASKNLHEVLEEAWGCPITADTDHSVKLCLDAKVEREVRLDLAISCHEKGKSKAETASEPPVWLYVQSTSIEAATSQPLAQTLKNDQGPSQLCISLNPKMKSRLQECSPACETRPSKRRRTLRSAKNPPFDEEIMFSGQPNDSYNNSVHEELEPRTLGDINLCLVKYLKQNYRFSSASASGCFVGYLESPKLLKHMFYLEEGRNNAHRQTHGVIASKNLISLQQLMTQPMADCPPVTVVNQLQLAHKIATSVLQFHSTPWLREQWGLENVSFFGRKNAFDEESLRTLHLSTQISNHHDSPRLSKTQESDSTRQNSDTSTAYIQFGITNWTMFSLGAALIQLERWKPLEAIDVDLDENIIYKIRALGNRPKPCGFGSAKYQNIIQKCLGCNFGVSTNLKDADLQGAVYVDVVCELEDMINSLKKVNI